MHRTSTFEIIKDTIAYKYNERQNADGWPAQSNTWTLTVGLIL